MKIIITEKQALFIKKLLLEGVNPDDYVKALFEVLGISMIKTSGEISEALGKNPLNIKIRNADGSIESLVCKNLDELIVASQKLAKSEIDFTSGIKAIVKENPNLKIDFGSSLYKGNFGETVKNFIELRNKFSKQTTTPPPISNNLTKQKIAESDIEQILKTRVTEITDKLNEFMFKTTTPDGEITLPKGFEFDIRTNPTKALQDFKTKLLTLYGLQNANEGYIRNLKQIFSKRGGVYDSDSVDFNEINKLIDEYEINSEKLYDQTILDLTKIYNDLDGMKLHVEEKTSPLIVRDGPRSSVDDEGNYDDGFPKDDFLDATLRGEKTQEPFSALKFGFDLNHVEGEIKSSDFNPDFININALKSEEPPSAGLNSGNIGEPKATSFHDYIVSAIPGGLHPEFPEDDIASMLMKQISKGLELIKSGNLQWGLDHLPESGFERWGIDNFKEFIKNAYEENRLLIDVPSSYSYMEDLAPERVRFTIELRQPSGVNKIDINKLRDMDLYDRMLIDDPNQIYGKSDRVMVPSVSDKIDPLTLDRIKSDMGFKFLKNSTEEKNNVIKEIKKLRRLIRNGK
jgi:hypothetical protein